MPRNPEAHQFAKTADNQYVCVTWFERDRQNVRLETPRGRVIFDLWDDDVTDAIEANISTRVKMGQSSDVFAVAMMNDGKVLFARKEIKVTLGGCGG